MPLAQETVKVDCNFGVRACCYANGLIVRTGVDAGNIILPIIYKLNYNLLPMFNLFNTAVVCLLSDQKKYCYQC